MSNHIIHHGLFFEEYLQECVKDPEAKKNHYYFDIMNQHTYSRATDMYDYVAVLRKLMQQYLGEQKPVWITECGAKPRQIAERVQNVAGRRKLVRLPGDDPICHLPG